MENLLNIYALPYDPLHPVVCYDERPCQLLDHVISPLPMKPGKEGIRKEDSHYMRCGTCSILLAVEPLTGFREQRVETRRTKKEFALFMKNLCDQVYPDAEKIILILDNLSTHSYGALYETFSPEEASRLAYRIAFHFTPKKASWLNMAEIEFSALSRQCLSSRIPDINTMKREVDAWSENRNRQRVKINWQFTTVDAREKLGRHYEKVRN